MRTYLWDDRQTSSVHLYSSRRTDHAFPSHDNLTCPFQAGRPSGITFTRNGRYLAGLHISSAVLAFLFLLVVDLQFQHRSPGYHRRTADRTGRLVSVRRGACNDWVAFPLLLPHLVCRTVFHSKSPVLHPSQASLFQTVELLKELSRPPCSPSVSAP